MRAIATVCLSGDLRSKLAAVARAGFDGVEIFENDLLSFDGTPEELRELCDELKLDIVAFQPFRDFEAMPEPARTRNFERAERKFELMKLLGTDFMLICSNVSPQCMDDRDQAARDLRELAERAAVHGLRIGYEALAWGRHVDDYRVAWDIVERADHPALGVVIDSFHILSKGHEVDTLATIPGDRIAFVQIADAPLLDMDVLQWSRHYRCFPGQGRLPLESFMTALAKTGYDGPLSLEIFNDAFRAAPAEGTALDGLRSLIWLEQLVPESQWAADLPAPAAYQGVNFIEFTLDEESAEPLGSFIAALGFRHVGRHRSKNVELWRQGDVHLVLNFETDSFAHTFRLVHGTSVCALGVRTSDPAAVLARAAHYRAPLYKGPVGEQEMDIPALRGVEGSLIYLVDEREDRRLQWETDFVLRKGPDGAGKEHLGHIDHVSYVLPSSQLLGWVLFYRTILGFSAEKEAEFADPHGMVMSQTVTSPDVSIRLPLTVSSAADTQSGRFLSQHRGGVQQIAFTTHDIFSAIDDMRDRGLSMLHIPDNYYDDLGARYGLSFELLDAMKYRNVLYDRNDDGEFFHAYTATFQGRFFFEIVERRGEYNAYGEANAPIRLAAQAASHRRGE
ncbi:bifunctional sugar phosphate isomerase/epimerase/4-hydroxyphenylpyruvate dioxygenase family protein [Larsenimonas rhizosphaerae]|uniref:3-dehydroshikimate dehydratase n=1 Tax=Larsenimonas rhizosphaerae TaxID=2944682 RepID=A0AA42CYH1_9GAMM|nr:sugar phosphate isomerase/epimerase and 4-hydroxyphenylpyruvate domain-containing protein [Larsenimonas rhizosphaerae]MCX2525155.1 TIM barrel protein [Larsenimonas rhizosphaerae]